MNLAPTVEDTPEMAIALIRAIIGGALVSASVGPAGELVAVWTAPDGLEAVSSMTGSAAGASFPDPGAARPVAVRITVHTPELAAVTQIAEMALAHITVQPMPNGK